MGTNLPSTHRLSLEWLEGHIAQWNTNFAAIGLTSAQVIDLAQDIANARGDFTGVQQIRDDSRASTQSWYSVSDALHAKAADLITTIKSFAANNADPAAVYLAAGMTPKDPPSPVAGFVTSTRFAGSPKKACASCTESLLNSLRSLLC